MNARLVAPDGTGITKFAATRAFVSGNNAFSMTFPWSAISPMGKDGPYFLDDLSIYRAANSDEVGFLVRAYKTAPYDSTGATFMTFPRLRKMLLDARTSGAIDSDGLLESLEAKVDAAEASFGRGQSETAKNQLEAFRNELAAQSGKGVSSLAAVQLDHAAELLEKRL